MAAHPDDDWRQRIAHAASPWEWNGRALAGLGVAIGAFVALFAVNFWVTRELRAGTVVGFLLALLCAWLFFVRPYIKSVRRWQVLHPPDAL